MEKWHGRISCTFPENLLCSFSLVFSFMKETNKFYVSFHKILVNHCFDFRAEGTSCAFLEKCSRTRMDSFYDILRVGHYQKDNCIRRWFFECFEECIHGFRCSFIEVSQYIKSLSFIRLNRNILNTTPCIYYAEMFFILHFLIEKNIRYTSSLAFIETHNMVIRHSSYTFESTIFIDNHWNMRSFVFK